MHLVDLPFKVHLICRICTEYDESVCFVYCGSHRSFGVLVLREWRILGMNKQLNSRVFLLRMVVGFQVNLGVGGILGMLNCDLLES